MGSAKPVVAVWAVVTGREVAHTRWSDASAVRVRKCGNRADIHGTWVTWSLAPPVVDGNIPKPVFAEESMGGVPESATESGRTSWGGTRDTSCANFGVGHTSARALDVEQRTWVAEAVAVNLDVQTHTSMVRMSGYELRE
jgi:hypothetical protein